MNEPIIRVIKVCQNGEKTLAHIFGEKYCHTIEKNLLMKKPLQLSNCER
jgi:hypothetical protein